MDASYSFLKGFNVIPDAVIAHDVVKETSLFWPILSTILITAATVWGTVIVWLQYRDQKQKEIQAEKDAALEKEKESEPKIVTENEFEIFKLTNKYIHDDLERLIKETSATASSASKEITNAAKEIRIAQNDNAAEVRDTLKAFEISFNVSLEKIHDKIIGTDLRLARVDERVINLERKQREAS